MITDALLRLNAISVDSSRQLPSVAVEICGRIAEFLSTRSRYPSSFSATRQHAANYSSGYARPEL